MNPGQDVLGRGPRLLLVEDDDGDAQLVEELLVDSGEPFQVERATSVAAALPYAAKVDCAVVDVGLPDAQGLRALEALRAEAPDLAIVVLAGLADRTCSMEALASGAQDYLVKGEVDAHGLALAVHYAIERRRTERDARLVLLTRQRQEENERLARGLLPHLPISGPVSVTTRYRPGAEATLGGDFYDAVLLDDGRLRAVIGDVCGHGPAEAAIGVALRIAWRTMTVAGATEADTLAAMEQVLEQERDGEPFATVCDLTIDLAVREVTMRVHGHPRPLLVAPDARWMEPPDIAPPLGILQGGHVPAPPCTMPLPPRWSLMLLTDGLFEGRHGDERLGEDGLLRLVRDHAAAGQLPLDDLLAQVHALHGGELDDDLAILLLSEGT